MSRTDRSMHLAAQHIQPPTVTVHSQERFRSAWARPALVICVAAVLLLWPAYFNRYPLLIEDSLAYFSQGRSTWHTLLHLHDTLPPDPRGLPYMLVQYVVGWQKTMWTTLLLNAAVVAWTLWMMARSTLGRASTRSYAMMMLVLCLMTTLPWYTSMVLTDVYGATAYLGLCLLARWWDELSRLERWVLAAIACFGIAIHPTHWMVSFCLLPLLFLWQACVTRPVRHRYRGVCATGLVWLSATVLMVALNWGIYGKPSLTGPGRPYLMARLIGDKTGRWYLQQHCTEHTWVVCRLATAYGVPEDANVFLYDRSSFLHNATPEERDAIRREEMPFVLATVRTYPREQLRRSWENFRIQLRSYSMDPFAVPRPWVLQGIGDAVPNGARDYAHSRQWSGGMRLDRATRVQEVTLQVSMLALLVLAPLAWLLREHDLLILTGVFFILAMVNALVCGVLSMPDVRYQGRIIWLIPLSAILLAFRVFFRRHQLVAWLAAKRQEG